MHKEGLPSTYDSIKYRTSSQYDDEGGSYFSVYAIEILRQGEVFAPWLDEECEQECESEEDIQDTLVRLKSMKNINEVMARKFGGGAEVYASLNNFMQMFDREDSRYSCVLNHSFGIFVCEQRFGYFYPGTKIPTRILAEFHVVKKLDCIPTIGQWLSDVVLNEKWQIRGAKPLGIEYAD